jgi:hypothetical protein
MPKVGIYEGVELEWFRKFGWRENPLTINPIPESLVIRDLRDRLEEYLMSRYIVSLYGETGTGKSSILLWFEKNLKGETEPVYIDLSSTQTFEGFLEALKFKALKKGFFERLLSFTSPEIPLIDTLRDQYKNKILVLLLDEPTSVKDERISEYLRAIHDHVKSAMLISSIKPLSTIEAFKESFRTGRVFAELQMRAPNFTEVREMLRDRFELVGGKGIHPFSDDSLAKLLEYSGPNPKNILIQAATVLMKMSERNEIREVTSGDVQLFLGEARKERIPQAPAERISKPVSEKTLEEIYKNISKNQRKIVDALKEKPKTAYELEKELGISYGSITKEIGRLMLQTDAEMMRGKGITDAVLIRGNERPYKYSLSDKWKLFLVKE